jgi:hypothetical protein
MNRVPKVPVRSAMRRVCDIFTRVHRHGTQGVFMYTEQVSHAHELTCLKSIRSHVHAMMTCLDKNPNGPNHRNDASICQLYVDYLDDFIDCSYFRHDGPAPITHGSLKTLIARLYTVIEYKGDAQIRQMARRCILDLMKIIDENVRHISIPEPNSLAK